MEGLSRSSVDGGFDAGAVHPETGHVTASPVRSYAVDARSTDVFGRVLWSCREQHFIADGPVQNGCPGEALTPAELFLAGIATCGVELVQVIAKADGVPLHSARARIAGSIDRERPVRSDVTVFTSVRLELELDGVDQEEAERLVEQFKRR